MNTAAITELSQWLSRLPDYYTDGLIRSLCRDPVALAALPPKRMRVHPTLKVLRFPKTTPRKEQP